jgi:hypothetical protein
MLAKKADCLSPSAGKATRRCLSKFKQCISRSAAGFRRHWESDYLTVKNRFNKKCDFCLACRRKAAGA